MSGTRYRACVCLLAAQTCAGSGKPAVETTAVRPVRAIKVGDLKAIAGREFPGRTKARDEVDLSFQVKHKGLRAIVVFEGRDAAGKGGTIKAITERVRERCFQCSTAVDWERVPLSRTKVSSDRRTVRRVHGNVRFKPFPADLSATSRPTRSIPESPRGCGRWRSSSASTAAVSVRWIPARTT